MPQIAGQNGTDGAAGLSRKVSRPGASQWPYYVLFFVSGFPALIYQIVWQRALFTLYGVNVESVTMVVSVFMLGLGLGSLAGGWLSRQPWVRLLPAYGVIEVIIGAFGAVSLTIFHRVGEWTAGASLPVTGLVAFAVLLVPTLLMGSTLPLLVEHLVRGNRNVGESVGILYSVNTFGSSVACAAAAYFLMRLLGESGSVRLSACLNLLVGVTAVLLQRDSAKPAAPAGEPPATAPRQTGRFAWGVLLAGVMGFAALGYEIVWYRIYSFTTGGTAPSFARLLAFYLAGIAYGSLAVRDACRKKLENDLHRTLKAAAIVVVAGSIAAFLVAPLTARLVTVIPYAYGLSLVFIAAALMGSAFPLISHAFVDPAHHSGTRVSLLYLSNIIGSTLGSFLIGFVVSNYWSTRATSVLLLAIGLSAAAAMALLAGGGLRRGFLLGTAACVALALLSGPLFSGLYERLLMKRLYTRDTHFSDMVENRSGVIAVVNDDIVYGGGAYDGRFNTNLVSDSNLLFRAFAVAGMNRKPASVLVIGLSTGSWVQVLAGNPDIQDMTVVEINPGYLPLIQKHQIVRSLLTNPKIHLVIDDGRRWLVSHPDRKFDLILMNTTWNWRANISNLLSTEFLAIVRQHLNPGGVEYYNTTWSPEALATGAESSPYALRVANFIAVSDQPIQIDPDRWRAALLNYRVDGRPALDLHIAADQAKLDQLIGWAKDVDRPDSIFETRASLLSRVQGARLITDDNMGTEWNRNPEKSSEGH
jgi:predicted membrane-bound spermidine synthase